MRRLARFVGLAAGLAAVVYVLRDKLVRIPEEAGPPPHFKAVGSGTKAPETTVAAVAADDLTVIKGIGPVYAERLRNAGIDGFAALAGADVAATADTIDVSAEQVADWAAQARQLVS